MKHYSVRGSTESFDFIKIHFAMKWSWKMAPFECKVQYLDDTDPFNSTTFPEPSRPPAYTFQPNISVCNQISGLHKLLKAPHNVRICVLSLLAPSSIFSLACFDYDGLELAWGLLLCLLLNYWWVCSDLRLFVKSGFPPKMLIC